MRVRVARAKRKGGTKRRVRHFGRPQKRSTAATSISNVPNKARPWDVAFQLLPIDSDSDSEAKSDPAVHGDVAKV